MRKFTRDFLRGILGLTAVMALGATFMALPAPGAEVGKSGTILPAQDTEQEKARKAAEAARAAETKKSKKFYYMEKSMEEEGRMEKNKSKTLQEPPAASGTKRLGGQTIRDKKTLEGD